MNTLTHKFVEYMPSTLEEGVLYISVEFATATHGCCCGCGNEVVTPLSPTDWSFNFDGVSISLSPSIGNWSFPCQSHYWIKRNRVCWAAKWSREEIDEGRRLEIEEKADSTTSRQGGSVLPKRQERGWRQRLAQWLR